MKGREIERNGEEWSLVEWSEVKGREVERNREMERNGV